MRYTLSLTLIVLVTLSSQYDLTSHLAKLSKLNAFAIIPDDVTSQCSSALIRYASLLDYCEAKQTSQFYQDVQNVTSVAEFDNLYCIRIANVQGCYSLQVIEESCTSDDLTKLNNYVNQNYKSDYHDSFNRKLDCQNSESTASTTESTPGLDGSPTGSPTGSPSGSTTESTPLPNPPDSDNDSNSGYKLKGRITVSDGNNNNYTIDINLVLSKILNKLF